VLSTVGAPVVDVTILSPIVVDVFDTVHTSTDSNGATFDCVFATPVLLLADIANLFHKNSGEFDV